MFGFVFSSSSSSSERFYLVPVVLKLLQIPEAKKIPPGRLCDLHTDLSECVCVLSVFVQH